MNFSTLLLLSLFATAFPLYGASECEGEREYRNDEGQCRKCQKCSAGFEPTEHCGYGKMDSTYRCKPCDAGTFSDATGYQLCKTCKPCSLWNSELRQACSSSSNAICGDCLPNYYRLIKSDGTMDAECHLCEENSKLVECNREPSSIWLVLVISVVVLIIGVAFIFFLSRKWRNKGDGEGSVVQNHPGVFHQVACDVETPKSPSLEPLNPSPSNRNRLPPDSNYSNLTTAEFQPVVELKKLNPPVTYEVGVCSVVEEVESITVGAFDTDSIDSRHGKNTSHPSKTATSKRMLA